MGKGTPVSERILSMERVKLDSEILGFSVVILSAEGHDFPAQLVASERRDTSEVFTYRVEGEDIFSVFTKFYDGDVLGHIQAGRKCYFVSTEVDEHLVTSSLYVEAPEVVYYPNLVTPMQDLVATAVKPNGKRRAVRSGSLPPTVWINIAISTEYRDAVGGADKVTKRVIHLMDRQNTAYRSSGFNGRMAIREIFFFERPAGLAQADIFDWAVDAEGPINKARALSKAAGTLVLFQNSYSPLALITSPAPLIPRIEVAIAGKIFASWDDGDIVEALHELGHLSGGDHNPESSSSGPNDPQLSARDWYSCEEAIYGALSYNICNIWLKKIEMYSGLRAVYGGKVRGKATQNNVGTFELVFQFMKGEHD
jgi:hypothetical protein